MRLLSYLLTFLTALLLAACGGGGGSPGLSTGSGSAFVVVAPTAVTLQVGTIQKYSISGGVKPYTVVSSDPAIAVGWLISDEVLAVGVSEAGRATITAQDARGSKFAIAVLAGSNTAFFTTAPGALRIAPGETTATTYRMGGGTPPYTAVSSNPSFVSAVANGNDLTIKALRLDVAGDTAVTVTLLDSSSPKQVLTTNVTVGSLPLAVNPTAASILIGSVVRYIVTGGTPPYRALASLDNCVTAVQIIQGNIVQAMGNKACTGSTLVVIDANNKSISVDISVQAGTSALTVTPITFTIPESSNTPNLSLLVFGATGLPMVFTTDTSILPPQAPVSNSDGTYTITLSGGNTCSLTVTPGSAAIPALDLNNDGDYTDPGENPFIPAVPATGGDRNVTITVLDPKGRQGTSVLTVKDVNGVGGC